MASENPEVAPSSRLSSLAAALIAIAGTFILSAPAHAGVTWWVDGSNSSCSDSGPGSAGDPFCTIESASAHAAFADTVLVKPGVYREQVTAPSAPITYRAAMPGAVILGTFDLSNPSDWQPTGTTAWSRAYAPPDAPNQVFLDGARLSAAPSATETTPNSFFYEAVAKILYVDIGGGNPAEGHVIEAGGRLYGFFVAGRSHVLIEGFTIQGQNNSGVRLLNSSGVTVRGTSVSSTGVYGIQVEGGAGTNEIAGNEVSSAATHGIRLMNTTGVMVSGNATHHNGFHGISLQGSNGNAIVGNRSYSNLRPEQRSATGISLKDFSSDNLVYGNTTYLNDDSGVQIYTGSDRNLVARNVSWANGDHGFDTVGARDTRYVSNTSYRNTKDGFSVEGSAINTLLANNIAVDNGLTTNEFDLFVDASSVTGFRSDFDLLWKSDQGSVARFNGTRYTTLADFAAATGQEAHGVGADPMFVDAAQGDLHVLSGSPAIDSANAGESGFVSPDHDGRMPFNVLSVADTGAGSPPYADRGAYEFAECDPGDGGEPTPGLTTDLRFTGTGGTDLAWSPAPNALFHNLYRGTITDPMAKRLPASVFDHVCFESGDDQGNGGLTSSDIENPPVGTAFYYLSDGEGCSEGPLDSDASHPVPNPDPCPTEESVVIAIGNRAPSPTPLVSF